MLHALRKDSLESAVHVTFKFVYKGSTSPALGSDDGFIFAQVALHVAGPTFVC
jgi:hypothetical protein